MILGTELEEPEAKIIELDDGTYGPGADPVYDKLTRFLYYFLWNF